MIMPEETALLLLPRLRVQNANALSGPLSWGFPAPSAFTGFVHALERKLRKDGILRDGFGGVGIICHRFEPQISKPAGKYNHVLCLTRNPVDKNGDTSAIVEEGRVHLDVSLLIAVKDYMSANEGANFAEDALAHVLGMRLAGGTILPGGEGKRFDAQYVPLADDAEGREKDFRKVRRSLLPGFALVLREDRLQECLDELRENDSQATALDALLHLSRLNIEPDVPDPDRPGQLKWGVRKKPGWLVPVPVGYAGISPLYGAGEVRNTRDDVTDFRFVEALYSIGEWISPHRLTSADQLFWYHEADKDKGIYRCVNNFSNLNTNQ